MEVAAAVPDKAGRLEALAKAERILLDDYIFAPNVDRAIPGYGEA